MNEKEFEYLGIKRFHDKGYKGQDITIASKENIIEGVFDDVFCLKYEEEDKWSRHGTQVMDFITQVVPLANRVAVETNGTIRNGVLTSEGMDFLQEIVPDILTTSFHKKSDIEEPKKSLYKELYDKGCFLVCSAGNKDEEVSYLARLDLWYSIGACRYNNGSPKKERDYVEDETIDCYSLHNLYTQKYGNTRLLGTSFSTPLFAGMLALVQCMFLDKRGKKLTNEELVEFIKENTNEFGVFVLPDPDSIKCEKRFNTYLEWREAVEFLASRNEMDSPHLWLERIEVENDIDLMWFCVKWANAVARANK